MSVGWPSPRLSSHYSNVHCARSRLGLAGHNILVSRYTIRLQVAWDSKFLYEALSFDLVG